MSGQSGNRGYLMQALVALLNALDVDVAWQTLTVEPDPDQEKVDIAWRNDGCLRVVQVKSSQNAISRSDVTRWATELEMSILAEEYELILIGPISGRLTGVTSCGKVRIPTPQPLNLSALIDQASHRIDVYLQRGGHASVRPTAREILVNALTTKISGFSTKGTAISRNAFNLLLNAWVDEVRKSLPAVDVRPLNRNVPHQIPPAPADFTGRQTELLNLARSTAAINPTIIGIRGLAGVGKTSFGLTVSKTILDHYPDGQIFLDLKGTTEKPLQTRNVMTHIVNSLNGPNCAALDHDMIASAFRTTTHNKRVLLFCDNAASAEQLQGLMVHPTNA